MEARPGGIPVATQACIRPRCREPPVHCANILYYRALQRNGFHPSWTLTTSMQLRSCSLAPPSSGTPTATLPPMTPTREVMPAPVTPPQTGRDKGNKDPHKDDNLSVFGILNIFYRRWFLSRVHLLKNIISVQKAEDGDTLCVEFTPQFHSHLVKCTVALVPHILSCLVGRVTWPSLNSRRVAARPITPKRFCTFSTEAELAVLPSEKGNGRLRKRPNDPHVSGDAWHVGASSIPAKPPGITSAPNSKWVAYESKQLKGRSRAPHPQHRWTRHPPHPPSSLHPLTCSSSLYSIYSDCYLFDVLDASLINYTAVTHLDSLNTV